MDLHVEALLIEAGDPRLTITAEAERQSADLIVMGTRGLTGLKHVALGSVAHRVVRTAPSPVRTVPSSLD
ncbi:MAG: universal stress protein [Myxococcota bacterium]